MVPVLALLLSSSAPAAPAPLLVADNTTAVPNADGKFTFFSAPKCSGGSSFFVGSPDSGEGGIFNAVLGDAPPTSLGTTVRTGPPHWADAMPGAPSGTTIFQTSDWAGVRPSAPRSALLGARSADCSARFALRRDRTGWSSSRTRRRTRTSSWRAW